MTGAVVHVHEWTSPRGERLRYLLDESRVEWLDDAGVVVRSRPFTVDESAWARSVLRQEQRQSRRRQVTQAASDAMRGHLDYLAAVDAGTATGEAHDAQVAALTRQVVTLTRLLVGGALLDDGGGAPS